MIVADESIRELDRLNLAPGELYIGSDPAMVTTVLGSCVAVTLYSPRLEMGGICHAMLPGFEKGGDKSNPFRYIDRAVEHMKGFLDRHGTEAGEIETGVYGGASLVEDRHGIAIGARNASEAMLMIQGMGLRLLHVDVGGWQGRKVLFNTCTGGLYIRVLGERPRQHPWLYRDCEKALITSG